MLKQARIGGTEKSLSTTSAKFTSASRIARSDNAERKYFSPSHMRSWI